LGGILIYHSLISDPFFRFAVDMTQNGHIRRKTQNAKKGSQIKDQQMKLTTNLKNKGISVSN
jgi:hypothetical protein